MEYKQWLNEWLEIYIKPSVKVRTYEKYEIMVNKHIVPGLGEYQMENLSAGVLQRFVVNLSKKRSTSYVNSVITVLRESLQMSVILGVSLTQNADKIIRPKTQEKKVECFTVKEQRKIEKVVLDGKNKRPFGIVLCLYTGLRLGEILSLQWSDIDLKKGTLTVNHSCHYGKNESGVYGIILDTPKTPNSRRVIPVPKQLLPYLRDMKKNSKSEYVINNRGKPINPRAYQYDFTVLLKRLNIPHRCFHSLRHTFATRAIECGMDIKTLSELLGHKNPTVTLNRYAHSLMEYKTEMMNKLGKTFTSISSS